MDIEVFQLRPSMLVELSWVVDKEALADRRHVWILSRNFLKTSSALQDAQFGSCFSKTDGRGTSH